MGRIPSVSKTIVVEVYGDHPSAFFFFLKHCGENVIQRLSWQEPEEKVDSSLISVLNIQQLFSCLKTEKY